MRRVLELFFYCCFCSCEYISKILVGDEDGRAGLLRADGFEKESA